MRLETERVFDRNVVGLALGERRLRDGVLLVTAHHDGLGPTIDGRARPGAVDGAAGVAVLLELARRFAESPAPLTVAFASHGANEWGLIGARSLAQAWPAHWPVRAVIGLDAVGERGEPLQLLGAEAVPDLAVAVGQAARGRGLAVTAAAGAGDSDHVAWADAGVPALGLRQARPETIALDGGAPEHVDAEALAELTDAIEEALRALAAGGND
jgi:Zn-dependent M28 family amino/carboxypeptidase